MSLVMARALIYPHLRLFLNECSEWNDQKCGSIAAACPRRHISMAQKSAAKHSRLEEPRSSERLSEATTTLALERKHGGFQNG
jgi:hypothetical protein